MPPLAAAALAGSHQLRCARRAALICTGNSALAEQDPRGASSSRSSIAENPQIASRGYWGSIHLKLERSSR
jgi:hypothetical protein